MRLGPIAVLLAGAALAAPASASAQSFLGRWTATAEAPDGLVSEEIVARETDQGYAIAVTMVTEVPPGTPAAGPGYEIKLEGDSFSYKRSLTIPEVGEIVVTYAGTVTGDAFTGTAEIGGFKVPYNGVRSSRPN